MSFFKKIFGNKKDNLDDIFGKDESVQMTDQCEETDPYKKRLKEVRKLIDFYRSDSGQIDEETIIYRTNIEVGKELIQYIYNKSTYSTLGLFTAVNGSYQHWSYMLLKAIKLKHSDNYKEICERINLKDFLDLKNENLIDFLPERKLTESEQFILWNYYCTKVNLEEDGIVKICGLLAGSIRNEIEAEQLNVIEQLQIEERELEVKIQVKNK